MAYLVLYGQRLPEPPSLNVAQALRLSGYNVNMQYKHINTASALKSDAETAQHKQQLTNITN